MNTLICNKGRPLQEFTFSRGSRFLVLAPHPDDFDAIGVTLRFLKEKGHPLYVGIATSGASGVEDSFCRPPTADVKMDIREKEQTASCRYFGLPESHLSFLRLEEDEAGHPLENGLNLDCMRRHLLSVRPAFVFMPHWQDTNFGHQRIYSMFRQIAQETGCHLATFLNRDPKTIRMRCDVYLGFGEEEAVWKAKLLRFHRSQHQRNLNHRGCGFDERILMVDRQSAEVCPVDTPYAEVFELEFFGVGKFEEIFGTLYH